MGSFLHNDTMKIDFNTYHDNHENNEYNAPTDNFESFKNMNDPNSSMIPSKIMNTRGDRVNEATENSETNKYKNIHENYRSLGSKH